MNQRALKLLGALAVLAPAAVTWLLWLRRPQPFSVKGFKGWYSLKDLFFRRLLRGACLLVPFISTAQTSPQIVQLNSAQLWQRLEFSITNVPAASNPFDPDIIRLDARFTLPSGRGMTVPAFWYQGYQRTLSSGNEYDIPTGTAGWRLRFTPPEAGAYSLALTILTNGQLAGEAVIINFSAGTNPPPARIGNVGVARGSRYFQTGDGQALRWIGEDVGWPDHGTYDYDTWFSNMQNAGENYARIWMCPWAFGIEDTAASLNRYSLQPAWQLDYVFELAERRGIYIVLTLDYHGMFATLPDYWGGNNFWPRNPYNVTNGGPCAVANDFFTNSSAKGLYQKRLRYLIARYGYSQNLLAWEFFNEIDNDYGYLNSADVATWHSIMGGWMHTNDVFGHLVTTSLTGGSDRPEIWSQPQLDYVNYHSYGEVPPAKHLNAEAQTLLQKYNKPVLIEEFGTDWRGWNRTNDSYLRGFRQGIWGGALSGSAGTAMPWYWQNIDSENDYSVFSLLGRILNRTGWGIGAWTNISFQTQGSPPVTVGNPVPGGQPVNVQLRLNGSWGVLTSGQLAVPGPLGASYSAQVLDAFVQGIAHPELKTPFQLRAWLTNNARLVMHLNSVSDGSIMTVLVDGARLFRTNLPNLNGTGVYSVNESYNLDVPVNLPAGLHLVTITNAGNDWFYLDWVRLEQVLPSTYSNNWLPSPDAIGQRGPHESLLYVVAPGVSFAGSDTTAVLPLQAGQTVAMPNWPPGKFFAEWYDPATGTNAGYSEASTTNGTLTLPLPAFSADLAGIIYPPPVLMPLGIDAAGAFEFQLGSETGGRYFIEQSFDLSTWTTFSVVTNATGALTLTNPPAPTQSSMFLRAHQSQ